VIAVFTTAAVKETRPEMLELLGVDRKLKDLQRR